MKVQWHRFNYDDKEVTAPVADHMVWIMEMFREPHVTLGYFDGFTFRLWTGTDDCEVTHWAHIELPEAPTIDDPVKPVGYCDELPG